MYGIMTRYICNEENQMHITYKKLWKLLIDRDLKKKDLIAMAGISNYTLNKLNSGKSVTTVTIAKICRALNCEIEDIMELSE